MKASCAVTVKLKALPAIAVGGALTAKCVAAAGLTVIPLCVPVMEMVTVSVAVRLRLPTVFKVALKVPVPLLSVEFAGRAAAVSLLAN